MGGDSFRQEEHREQQVVRDVTGQSTYQVLQQQQTPPAAGPEGREASSLGTLTQQVVSGEATAVEQELIEQVRQQYVSSVEQAYQASMEQFKAQAQTIFETGGPEALAAAQFRIEQWKQLQLEAFNVAIQSPEKYPEWLQQHSQEIFNLAGIRGVVSLANLPGIHSQIEQAAQAKVRGETITAIAIAAGIGATVAAPVVALSGAAAGATFETVKTGIMEGKLPTAEQLITAAGVSAAGAAVMSAAAPVISEVASKVTSTVLPEAVSNVATQIGETLTSTGLSGVVAREALGTSVGAVAGGVEAAVKGEDVLKGVAAGAVAGAAAAAVGELTYRGLSNLEEKILGIEAMKVKGGESYEITRETEELIGGTRITKVEAEPTRITEGQAELVRYTQIEEVKMAGTADVIYKGGEDILKQTGIGWEASYQGKAAEDILEAAAKGGDIITEQTILVKEIGTKSLRLAEYQATTAELTGVQAFGKIDPQVYLDFIKNVSPEVAAEWLTQMGGVPVSQLSQITSPINIVMHEVFVLPAATVPVSGIVAGITGAAVSDMAAPSKIEISPAPVVSPAPAAAATPTPVSPTLEPAAAAILGVTPKVTPTIVPDIVPAPSPKPDTTPIVPITPTPQPDIIPVTPTSQPDISPIMPITPTPELKPETEVTPNVIITKPRLIPHVKSDVTIEPMGGGIPEILPIIKPETKPEVTPEVVITPTVKSDIIVPEVVVTPEVTPSVTPTVTQETEVVQAVTPKVSPDTTQTIKPGTKLLTEPVVLLETDITQEVSPIVVPEMKTELIQAITPTIIQVTPEITPAVKPSIVPEVTPTVMPIVTPEVTPSVTPQEITVQTTTQIQQTVMQPTPTPVTPTPSPRPIPIPPLWIPSHEGSRIGDVGRLIFGGQYVKLHQIALPKQVVKFGASSSLVKIKRGKIADLSVAPLVLGKTRKGKRSRSGFGLVEGGTVGSLVFGKSKRGNIFGGSTVGSLIFGRSRVSKRRGRGSNKSWVKGSVAEVIFK